MPTQVILLERIESLGAMGDVVSVKPGYARNYLLPQNKALRATESNIAYFETQKAALEKANNEKKKEAETRAKKVDGQTVALIRQAGETGQLYGSVTARDIAESVTEATGEKIERSTVDLNQNVKEIGLFPVTIALHPEVKVTVTINVARTEDEAKTQAKTGKALIVDDAADAAAEKAAAKAEAAEKSKAELMDKDALEAEKAAEAEAAEKAAEEEAKAAAKAEAKATRQEEEGEEISAETASDEGDKEEEKKED